MNDHIVVCQRDSAPCEAYFKMFSRYQACNGTMDFKIDDGNQLLKDTLVTATGADIRMVAMQYTMFRSCAQVRDECYRVPAPWLQEQCRRARRDICNAAPAL